jgi:hypothetical protein
MGILKGPRNDVRKRLKVVLSHRTWADVARSSKGPAKNGIRMKRLALQ